MRFRSNAGERYARRWSSVSNVCSSFAALSAGNRCERDRAGGQLGPSTYAERLTEKSTTVLKWIFHPLSDTPITAHSPSSRSSTLARDSLGPQN